MTTDPEISIPLQAIRLAVFLIARRLLARAWARLMPWQRAAWLSQRGGLWRASARYGLGRYRVLDGWLDRRIAVYASGASGEVYDGLVALRQAAVIRDLMQRQDGPHYVAH